jgi:flavin reductase (DIM6/NTAB) family NADH-FMN oxidoreductase RutF
VVALCSLIDGSPVGMVASTFACVSLAPPLVSVCIQRVSTTWAKLKHARRIGVSCLSAAQGEACRQLAAKSDDRFAGLDWSQTDAGAVLLDGATALFDCRLYREIPAGDHEIILLEISAIQMKPDLEPLVFHGSTFRAFEAREPVTV